MADPTTTDSASSLRQRPWNAPPPAPSGPIAQATELKDLVVAYAKQETITPLRSLGRYLGFGVAGSLLVFLGAFFLGLGVLRLLQSLSPFAGSSWASALPYVVAIVALADRKSVV